MNTNLINIIKNMELSAIDKGISGSEILDLSHRAFSSLQDVFPFYDVNMWEALTFSPRGNMDVLAESQRNIMLEMDKAFLWIYERLLNEAISE